MYTFQFNINNGKLILEVWGNFAGLVLFAHVYYVCATLPKKRGHLRDF